MARDAQRTWHFSGSVPSGAQTAIRSGRNTITNGHALNAPENGASPNHVYWDTVCGVACMITDSEDNGSQHILGFQLHFDSSWVWNTNTGLGHGQFTGLDLWMVSAHEWGHAAGMGHSHLVFGHDCSARSVVVNGWATMTQGDCLVGGHTEQRDLHIQDWYGRCQIYSHAHGYACP